MARHASAITYKEQIKSLEQVEAEFGPFWRAFTASRGVLIGITSAEWLQGSMVVHRQGKKAHELQEASQPVMRMFAAFAAEPP